MLLCPFAATGVLMLGWPMNGRPKVNCMWSTWQRIWRRLVLDHSKKQRARDRIGPDLYVNLPVVRTQGEAEMLVFSCTLWASLSCFGISVPIEPCGIMVAALRAPRGNRAGALPKNRPKLCHSLFVANGAAMVYDTNREAAEGRSRR